MKNKDWKFKLGVILVLFSIVLFLLLPVMPFLPIETKPKLTISTVIFILAEITFYSGGFLVGKEIFVKYKDRFNPKNWFKKNE